LPSHDRSAISIKFQPTGGGKAAITGDFVALASEVNPLIASLRQHGIEVTAIFDYVRGSLTCLCDTWQMPFAFTTNPNLMDTKNASLWSPSYEVRCT
jgi:hypothetical protein